MGFTTQTSIRPTRFQVCLSKENETTRVAVRAAWLAVHLLREGDEDVARRFGEQSLGYQGVQDLDPGKPVSA